MKNIEELTKGDDTITNKTSIANELNNLFSNILTEIGNNQTSTAHFNDEKLKNFVSSRLNSEKSFEIPLLTQEQVENIHIQKISTNKATGQDDISVRVIKEITPEFANHYASY